jgi:hypothetical protein
MALVSVNSVIADIAQTVKEKLHKVVVAREAIKPVLYSGEDDRKADDDDDDDEDDATATVLNSRSIMKKGWLVKKGEVRRNWKVRYFVLFEDGRMPYYRGPKKARKDRPQGCIYLTGKVPNTIMCHSTQVLIKNVSMVIRLCLCDQRRTRRYQTTCGPWRW